MHHRGKKGFVSQTYRTGTVRCGTQVMAHLCNRDDTINYLEMTYINHELRAGTIGAHKWFSPSSPPRECLAQREEDGESRNQVAVHNWGEGHQRNLKMCGTC